MEHSHRPEQHLKFLQLDVDSLELVGEAKLREFFMGVQPPRHVQPLLTISPLHHLAELHAVDSFCMIKLFAKLDVIPPDEVLESVDASARVEVYPDICES